MPLGTAFRDLDGFGKRAAGYGERFGVIRWILEHTALHGFGALLAGGTAEGVRSQCKLTACSAGA